MREDSVLFFEKLRWEDLGEALKFVFFVFSELKTLFKA